MSFVAALLQLSKEQGAHPKAISDILATINVHPDLADLPRSIVGFRQVLREADRFPLLEIKGRDPDVWDEACEWLISLKDWPNISQILGNNFWFGDTPSTRNPVKNLGDGVRVFGFPYAALWFKPRDLENASDYYRLFAQLLMSFQRSTNNDNLNSQRYELYRLLERLSSTPHLAIPHQLGIERSHAVFVASCQDLEPRHLKKIGADNFSPATRIVRYFHGKRPAIRSGGRGQSGPRAKAVSVSTHDVAENPRGFVLADPDDPDQLPGYYTIVSTPTAETGGVTDPGELAPNELTPAQEIWLLDDEGLERPYVEDLLGAQNVEAHIIRSRQSLPFAYSLFTLTEVRNLLFGIGDMFEACLSLMHQSKRGSHQDTTAIELRMEAMLLVHIAVWFGQPITQISQMVAVDEASGGTDSPIALIRGTPDLFRLLVRSPTLIGDDRHQARSGVRDAASHVLLPDLAGSATLIDTLLRIFPRESNVVFTNQSDVLEAEAKQLLKEIGRGDARYTLTKVRTYLYAQICSDTGDVAVAAMLSGVVNPSAENPRYYLQPKASRLCELYVRTLEKVLTQIYACAGLMYEPVEINIEQDGAVGATHCLLPETVAENFKALKAVFNKKPRGSLRELMDSHNAYTLWVVQMFMLATGCRAIKNPLLFEDELDSQRFMGALSDKDSGDRHMSRLICLPEMVKKQLATYYSHCGELSRQLTGYLVIDSAVDQWRRGFFLRQVTHEIRRDPIRPGIMMQVMSQVPGYVPHRANALRKFVRTELAERGCPAEVLSAYMGHWLRGEEPQDRFSSFSPDLYRTALEQQLGRLLSDVGLSLRRSAWGAN